MPMATMHQWAAGNSPPQLRRFKSFWVFAFPKKTKWSWSSFPPPKNHRAELYSKYLPGPRLPPESNRPSRKMTALSYSWTTWNVFQWDLNHCWLWLKFTLKQTQREKGRVTMTRPQDMAVRSHPHSPMPLSDSSAASQKKKNTRYYYQRNTLGWISLQDFYAITAKPAKESILIQWGAKDTIINLQLILPTPLFLLPTLFLLLLLAFFLTIISCNPKYFLSYTLQRWKCTTLEWLAYHSKNGKESLSHPNNES